MRRLDVWLDGADRPAGTLIGRGDYSLSFRYRDDYLEGPDPRPLSICLPLGIETDDRLARAFFGNLLPENDQMEKIVERHRIDRDDIASILSHVGADCSGALSCLPEGSPPIKIPGNLEADYRVLDDAELVAIVESLADRQRLPATVNDPSPVAGVQRKIALTLTPQGQFALPRDGLHVPTTHILKVPRREEAADVECEAATCRLADACGFEASIPEIMDFGGVAALLITRFDRIVRDNVASRVHPEDFAQAQRRHARSDRH